MLLHALAQHSVGEIGSYVPTSDSAPGPSKEQESVKGLCEQHWRLCVHTCSSADCVRTVLSCAGLAGRGLADAAVEELVQRRCEVQHQRQQERYTVGQGCNTERLFRCSLSLHSTSDELAAALISKCLTAASPGPSALQAAGSKLLREVEQRGTTSLASAQLQDCLLRCLCLSP